MRNTHKRIKDTYVSRIAEGVVGVAFYYAAASI
jgi:hypothetical protein